MTFFKMKAEAQNDQSSPEKGNKVVGKIWLYEPIHMFNGTAKVFIDSLNAMGPVDELRLYINSPGGDVVEGLAIYHTLQRHSAAHKVAVIDGLAASMASVIAMAADEVEMPENSWFYVHNPWGVAVGEAKHMQDSADRLERMTDMLKSIYQRKSNLDDATLTELLNGQAGDGTWLTAQEAKGYGFADTVTPAVAIAALATHVPTLQSQQNALPPTLANLLPPPAVIKETETVSNKPEALTEMTLAQLQAARPELVQQLQAQAIANEQARLKAIDEASLPGYEDLVAAAKADPTKTAADVAIAIVAKQKEQQSKALVQFASNAAKPVAVTLPDSEAPAPEPNSSEAFKAQWAKEPADTKAGFGNSVDLYVAYHQGRSKGVFKEYGRSA